MAEIDHPRRPIDRDHPALGMMDAYQWLLFNGAHCKRHTAQILEVRADAGFPKS
ncbi:MAG: hypothetical protein ACR2ID_02090 [Chthoniobacterales bacterium]